MKYLWILNVSIGFGCLVAVFHAILTGRFGAAVFGSLLAFLNIAAGTWWKDNYPPPGVT